MRSRARRIRIGLGIAIAGFGLLGSLAVLLWVKTRLDREPTAEAMAAYSQGDWERTRAPGPATAQGGSRRSKSPAAGVPIGRSPGPRPEGDRDLLPPPRGRPGSRGFLPDRPGPGSDGPDRVRGPGARRRPGGQIPTTRRPSTCSAGSTTRKPDITRPSRPPSSSRASPTAKPARS